MATLISPTRSIVGTSLGTLYVRLTVNPQELIQGMANGERAVLGATNVMTRQIASFASLATTSLAAVGAASVYEFSRFDKAMTQSLSLMGDVTADMRTKMEQLALTLSTKSRQSATELADSYYFLASAGYNAEQSMALLPVTTRFATAANIEAKRAVDLLATAQSALGMNTESAAQNMENMTHISDVLVKANQLAVATVEQYAVALASSAGTMKVFGVSLEEGVALLADFAAQGIKGAQAGTALSIVLRDMQRAAVKSPEVFQQLGIAVYDSQGNFRKMSGILRDFQNALKGASDEERRQILMMLGLQDRSLRYTLALLDTSNTLDKFQTSLMNAGGTAQRVADTQLSSFHEQMVQVWHSIQMLAIEIGRSLAPTVLNMARDMESFAQSLTKAQTETGVLSDAVHILVDAGKVLVTGFLVVWTTLKSIATVISTGVVISFENMNLAVESVIRMFKVWFDTIYLGLIPSLYKLGTAAGTVVQLMVDLFRRDYAAAIVDSASLVEQTKDTFKDMADSMKNAVVESAKIIGQTVSGSWSLTKELTRDGVGDLKEQWNGLFNLVESFWPQKAAASKDVTEDIWNSVLGLNSKVFGALQTSFKQTITTLKEVATETKQVTDSASQTLLTGQNTPTIGAKGLIASSNLMKLLSAQGLGQTDSKTGIMDMTSFGKSIAAYNRHTAAIGGAAGLTDQFTTQSEEYQNQIQQTREYLRQIEELTNHDVQLTKEAQEAKIRAIDAYNKRLSQLQKAQSITLIQSGQSMFESLTTAVESFAGKQSAIYKGMFAASKAFAIAESIIKIQQGIANASALPFPANLAAIASVVAATANIVSTISSVSLAIQGRATGGDVKRGSPYTVGERGQELFVPAQDGTIISNQDFLAAKRRDKAVTVNVNNYSNAQAVVTERDDGSEKTIEVAIRQVKKDLASEIRDGRGEFSRALEGSYRLKRGKQ